MNLLKKLRRVWSLMDAGERTIERLEAVKQTIEERQRYDLYVCTYESFGKNGNFKRYQSIKKL